LYKKITPNFLLKERIEADESLTFRPTIIGQSFC